MSTAVAAPPSGHEILHIAGEMTIYRAAELKQELLSALDSAAALDIDLSQVTELDCSGVQLLLLARRIAAGRPLAVRFVAHSDAVRTTLATLGLAADFPDQGAPAPEAAATARLDVQSIQDVNHHHAI